MLEVTSMMEASGDAAMQPYIELAATLKAKEALGGAGEEWKVVTKKVKGERKQADPPIKTGAAEGSIVAAAEP